MHTIRIIQRSENHISAATFKGLYLADGKTLGNAPMKPSRKIEFIGNSDLVAYGVESGSTKCNDNQIRFYTNTNRSFGTLIAKSFKAQSVILGWSGKGLVRNFDSPSKRSSTSFPAYYDKTLGMLDVKWDFTKWIPDLVVVILGWNDFSSSPRDESKYPDDTMYIGDYHKFITVLRNHYPNAAVLCVATHIGHLVDYVKRGVAEETTSLQHPKVYYAEYPPDESFTLTGCNGHPSPNDHRIIAEALADTIKQRLGWDTAKVDVREMRYCLRATTSTPRSFNASMVAKQIFITGAASSEPNIMVRTVDGRTLRREKIDRQNRIVISIATLPAGVYFVGNSITGWKRFAITR
jgi:lysophospholipase L1-like esterase